MSQSIANFFKPKAAAAAPAVDGPPVEKKSKTSEEPPAKKEKESPAKSSTPPTLGRKRIRQAESESDNEVPATNDTNPEDKKQDLNSVLKAEDKPSVSASPKEDKASPVKIVKDEVKQPAQTEVKKEPERKVQDKKEPVKKEVKAKISDDHSKESAPRKADPKSSATGRDGAGDETDEDEDAADDDDDNQEVVLKTSMDFDARKECGWKAGEPVPYAHLAAAFEKIEATTKRLEITAILTRALRCIIETTPEDLLSAIYLCVNKLAPAHEGVELGLGDMVLTKALAEATGRQEKDIKLEYEKVGDLGIVAMKSRSTQRTMFAAKPLTIQSVYKSLLQIAGMSGKNSGTQKKDKIKSLLVASKGNEAQYVVRHLQGKMRIGLAEQTVLVALGHAVALSPPAGSAPDRFHRKEALERAVEIIKEVFCQLPCYDRIIPELLKSPLEELPTKCFLRPGIPVKPMLAHPTKGISEVLDRFADQTFTCEYKYDGERGQIHRMEDGTIKIFSRNSEDNTSKYPDVLTIVPEVTCEGITSFVLDTEVVAFDRKTRKILPFQVLSTRKRKDADETEITVQVCIFAFDILYLNGEPLLKKPLAFRRQALKDSFKEVEGTFAFATSKDVSDTEDILAFLNEAVAASCEGLMVKTLEAGGATYEPDKRSHKWLKVKKDYIAGMTDSLDLVPIGAFYGKGKRTGVYGAFLLACYNDETEDFETICKIGTGFSEQQLKDFHALLEQHVISVPKSYYRWEDIPKDVPDVWFEPKLVWEVAAADLSISPVHKAAAGLVDDSKGIALRFPRLLRVREDKGPEQATTSNQVAQMYQNQAVIGGD